MLNRLLHDIEPSLYLLESAVFALGLVVQQDLGHFGNSDVVVLAQGQEGGFTALPDSDVGITDLFHQDVHYLVDVPVQ